MQFNLDFEQRLPPSAQIGMKQADDNADDKWKHIWDACVLAVAKRKEFLTSDDVLAEFESLYKPPHTHNLAAIGPAMVRAGKMKVLEATSDYKRSERIEKRGNLQRVWRSKYYV